MGTKLEEDILITVEPSAAPKLGKAMVSGRAVTHIKAPTHAKAAELFLQWWGQEA